MSKDSTIQCPTCKKNFDIDPELEVGDTTYCPECYEELEIVQLKPVEIKRVESEAGWGEEEIEEDEE